ncbi:hemolysin III domain protein [Burkholderia pseudomallei]|nr:hemolysin III domain protein [Burkholderia pseudomallei]
MKCAFERECATASPSQVDNVEPERRARPPVGTIGGASTGIPDVPISNMSIPARRNGHRRRPCTRAPRRASAQCGTDAAVGVQTLSARVPAAQMRAIAVPDVWPCGRADTAPRLSASGIARSAATCRTCRARRASRMSSGAGTLPPVRALRRRIPLAISRPRHTRSIASNTPALGYGAPAAFGRLRVRANRRTLATSMPVG